MFLELTRKWFTDLSTIGELLIDGEHECYVLEDKYRPDGVKIPGETCVPEGNFKITREWSPKHQRLLPLLHDVPHFTGIEIHPGNFPRDTEGCLLPGRIRGDDCVFESTKAFDRLDPKIERALAAGEIVTIGILCLIERLQPAEVQMPSGSLAA